MRFMLIPLLVCGTVLAGYPLPAGVGFHHAVLVYHRAERTRRDLAPYVAEIENGVPRAWLFDAFLFLTLRTPSGRRTTDGATVREDWQACLDDWFAPNRDLAALEAAIADTAKRLGAPPTPRRVILAIPRPNSRVTDFGDVSGSGRSENLAADAGTRAVLRWYVRQAGHRFRAAHFNHLDLWGFYWVQEAVPPEDERLVRIAAAEVHAAGYRLSWIPWFRARGWDKWRELGFDTAILQPNYAFFSKHRGRIRRDRLALAAQMAAAHGMAVELELPMAVNDPRTRFYFPRYLADGAPARSGYQAGVTAWYLGRDNLERLCFSDKPWQRRLYHAIALFVHGEVVPDPDPCSEWRVEKTVVPRLNDGNWAVPHENVSSAIAEFATVTWVHALDMTLPAPGNNQPRGWCGLTVVDAKTSAAAPWRPVGWAFGPSPGRADAPWRTVTVPVRQAATALRVRFLAPDGTTPASPERGVCELRIDGAPVDTAVTRHRGLGCSYRISPESGHAQYGDSGRELADGVVPDNGYVSGKTVGWMGEDVTITFDLGRIAAVQRVEVVVEGGGYAGIRWPVNPVLLLEKQLTHPPRRADTGALPTGPGFVPGGPVLIDRRRAPDAATGRIVFAPASPTPAKFATVFLRASGWLMVSEIGIYAGGKNIAPAARYTFRPRPTPDESRRYADDGERLTDGRIARRFSPADLTGWHDPAPRTITVDLGVRQPVQKVTVWALGGGGYGIRAPAGIDVELSKNGTAWHPLGPARLSADIAKGKHIAPVNCTAESATPFMVRWLRLIVRSSPGWTLLSEIVIE